jgi:hypothetical protein
MIYRLAFDITSEEYLRVTGYAQDRSEIVSAMYISDTIFGVACRTAGLAPFQILRRVEAAREARKESGLDVCCEAVELNRTHVEIMCLRHGREMVA